MAEIDWDEAFSNTKYIPQGASYPQNWKNASSSFIDQYEHFDRDIAYGSHPRQVFDLFWPESQPLGLTVFIHGGYWIDLDKSYWSHLARGMIDRGWAVAIPSYVLAPEARISEITLMMAAMIDKSAGLVPGPILLMGHSAGGHLVTRMACKNVDMASETRSRIRRFVSISGVHDLRNLLHTEMNEKLQLTVEEAVSESPCLQEPVETVSVLIWVGSKERPEFLQQSEILRRQWENKVNRAQSVVEEGRHHFDVIDSLTSQDSFLIRSILELTDT